MVELSICVGSSCRLKGSNAVIKKLKSCVKENNLKDDVVIKAAFCLGHCSETVSVKFNDKVYSVTPETAEKFFIEVILSSME